MILATPRRSLKTTERVIDMFMGFNNTELATERHFSHTKNLSSNNFPTAETRAPRELLQTLAKPNGLLSFNGSLYTVDGTAFKRDGITRGTVTDSVKCMVEFNQFILIFPDMKAYDTVSHAFTSFANGTAVPTANPVIQRATVHNNRVFGVVGNNIYSSKQGDFKEWNVFAQLNTDSWATDVAGSVSFNVIGAYQNHVVMQSGVNMFELYGSKPSNFQVQETVKTGAFNADYIEINSVLYFANRDGIYAYSGGVPRKISEGVDIPFTQATLGSDGKKLFASVSDGTNRHLFTYDTATNVFYREDNLNVVKFALHLGKLHALLSDGKLLKFDSGQEIVEWELETTKIIDDTFNKSGMKRIELSIEMSASTSLSVWIKGDLDVGYKLVKSFQSETYKNLLIPVNLSQNCYKIRITGRGYARLTAIKTISQKGGKI
jgi:hypothetical protein